MFIILIGFGLMVTIYGLVFVAIGGKDRETVVISIKMIVIAGLIPIILGFIGYCAVKKFTYKEVQQTAHFELVPMTENSQISVIGSGGLSYVFVSSNDTNNFYSFYYKANDGSFKLIKVDVDATNVYEKDDCTPYVVEYTTYTKSKMNGILQFILTFKLDQSKETPKAYEIYIPTGTFLRT